MSSTLRSAIRRNLLRWYRKSKRDLPWRHTRDPYALWISETMLQQTQVNTVIPYYDKFLRSFPDVETLARAPLARVLRLWSGLGYYRRAKNLRTAAQQIVRRHAGSLPSEFDQLRALAGVGDYTAGALLSIAFGKRYAAVDGNARRVLSRIFAIEDERALRAAAADLVPRAEPGEFNQALMELGATVCTPKNQSCLDCAVNRFCASRSRRGSMRRARTALKFQNVLWPLAIVRRGNRILLRRRGAHGLLASLWELPGGELNKKEQAALSLRRHLREFRLPPARKLGAIRHAITHRRIRAPIYLFELEAKQSMALPGASWRWIDPARLPELATSSMTVKALALFSADEKNPR
jgi:A/G-specific adenine glycosylase